jgi:hypothetical protein
MKLVDGSAGVDEDEERSTGRRAVDIFREGCAGALRTRTGVRRCGRIHRRVPRMVDCDLSNNVQIAIDGVQVNVKQKSSGTRTRDRPSSEMPGAGRRARGGSTLPTRDAGSR